ncbi:unnamed protein product [Caenorhabditis auriculariae]|uniref:Uncharacterized protein n=1 Tax=Caenorhabditis auriculariae TaxID=2777116 RepID=A0A8S1H0W2_9PELO|nr:unnamed protein product [Caenorhabditis auriculariae]
MASTDTGTSGAYWNRINYKKLLIAGGCATAAVLAAGLLVSTVTVSGLLTVARAVIRGPSSTALRILTSVATTASGLYAYKRIKRKRYQHYAVPRVPRNTHFKATSRKISSNRALRRRQPRDHDSESD